MNLRYKPKTRKFETGAEYLIVCKDPTPTVHMGYSIWFEECVRDRPHRECGPAVVKANIAEFYIGGELICKVHDMKYLAQERRDAQYFRPHKTRKWK